MITLRESENLYDTFDDNFNSLAEARFDIRKLPSYVLNLLLNAYWLDSGKRNAPFCEIEELMGAWLTDTKRRRKRAFKMGGLDALIDSVNDEYFNRKPRIFLKDMQSNKNRLSKNLIN